MARNNVITYRMADDEVEHLDRLSKLLPGVNRSQVIRAALLLLRTAASESLQRDIMTKSWVRSFGRYYRILQL